MKLQVPYCSQFLDIADPYWLPRGCGMACMKMVFEYYGVPSFPLAELIERASREGGYGQSGWIHDYLVSLAQRNGLAATRREQMEGVDVLAESLKNGKPIIVSTIKSILGQKKFHMVLLIGYEERGGVITGLYYHDPESLEREKGQRLFVDKEIFLKEWRGMAIFIEKS